MFDMDRFASIPATSLATHLKARPKTQPNSSVRFISVEVYEPQSDRLGTALLAWTGRRRESLAVVLPRPGARKGFRRHRRELRLRNRRNVRRVPITIALDV
jgi:hypothetical protein